MSSSRIEYSEKYADEENEYRWVGPVWRLLCAGPLPVAARAVAGGE